MKNANPQIDARLLRLSPQDNVLIAMETLPASEPLILSDLKIVFEAPVPLGYKIAARDITAGEKIMKYGVPIGSATEAIAAGKVIHTHNMKSDYLPTYSREGNERFVDEH